MSDTTEAPVVADTPVTESTATSTNETTVPTETATSTAASATSESTEKKEDSTKESAPKSESASTTENKDEPAPVTDKKDEIVSSTPIKEERKIGKLNLSAFNSPNTDTAPATGEKATPIKSVGKLTNPFLTKHNSDASASPASSEDKPTPGERSKTVGKLAFTAAFQAAAPESSEKPKDTPTRTVGKLGGNKLAMNIPIFAPGSAPPAAVAGGLQKHDSATESPTAPAETTTSNEPTTTTTANESTAPVATASSSSSSSTTWGPTPPPPRTAAAPAGPGKLQTNALMNNLNSILGGGPRKPRLSVSEPADGGEPQSSTVAASSSSSTTSASVVAASDREETKEDGDNDDSGSAAPSITHAKRARVRRKSKSKPTQLQKSAITTQFQEIKVVEAKVAKITVVSTAPAESPKSQKSKSKSHQSTKSTSTSAMAIDTEDQSASAIAIPVSPTSAAQAAAALSASTAALIAAATPTVVAPEPVQNLQLDASQRAAWSAAAAYGEFVEPEFELAKADEYRMLTAAGSTFLKHGPSGKPEKRVVFVTANLMLYFMEPSKRNKPDPKFSMNLSLAVIPKIQVVKGKTTASFQRSTAAKVDENLCFSIINSAKGKELDLQCNSQAERDSWFAAVHYLLHLAQEQREQALLGSAMGSY